MKLHTHRSLTGIIELKICIHENSFVSLNHPSEISARAKEFSPEVKLVLNSCFDHLPAWDHDDEGPGADIDILYEEEYDMYNHVLKQNQGLVLNGKEIHDDHKKWILIQKMFQNGHFQFDGKNKGPNEIFRDYSVEKITEDTYCKHFDEYKFELP